MIVANFTLSSAQIQVLIAFRNHPDTRAAVDHPMHDVDHTVTQMKKLCRDGLLLWHAGDREKKQPPGYSLTPKGETMLCLVEGELRRTLAWFDGAARLPVASIGGGQHDIAVGKAELSERGKYRRKPA